VKPWSSGQIILTQANQRILGSVTKHLAERIADAQAIQRKQCSLHANLVVRWQPGDPSVLASGQ